MRKAFALTTVLILLAGLISACGGSNKNAAGNKAGSANSDKSSTETGQVKNPVKLTLMNGMVEIVDWLNEEIEAFNAANPGIEVEQEFLKEGTGALKIKIAAGDMPDIIMGIPVPQDYYDQDLMHDFADDPIWNRLVNPELKSALADPNRPDKVFSIPFNTTYQGLFYNKDIVNELGITQIQTWEQFVSALQTIKERKPDVAPLFLSGRDVWTLGLLVSHFPLSAYQQQYGVAEIDKLFKDNDPQLGFDKADGRIETFAQKIIELQELGLINGNAVTATYAEQTEAIANGKAAFVMQGLWALADMLKAKPDASVGLSSVPAMYDDVKPYLAMAADGSLSYPAKSEHPEEVQKFVDFITGPEALKGFSKIRNAPSAYADGQTDWSILAKDIETIQAENTTFIAPKITYMPASYGWDQFGKLLQDLLAGGVKSPQDFAKAFKADWEKAQR